ncbi:MAG TPA: hypothetical protein PKC60_14910 [Hydrogenophaga sp.]|uniref:hypothetical protein n=1 Tax=Hydrogenophaga sp. TaxID=1904254 RepID=UPI002C685912|nr:hypothetical protein [Hydrogenophaga sp.]HMN94515.1 hypothetical protein [Hydrogenophaga sp.]HMP11292.1 hypothetical protein [Hydrogenophaga sp.]
MLPDLLRLFLVAMTGALLSACASTPPDPLPVLTPSTAVITPPQPVPAEPGQCVPDVPARSVMATQSGVLSCTEPIDSLDQALAYAERVRPMALAELQAELKALGEPGQQPVRQMQQALVLMQMQQPVETARALGLLQRLQASATSEAEALRPLARLLADLLSNQRRLEEQVDRHAAQLRDAQRRIDRLGERLEAMRAIERSLGPRGSPVPAAPRGVTP